MKSENISSKINNWLEQIDQITRRFHETFGELTEEQLNQKPNKQTWSIAQNMEHLIIINESYFPLLEKLRKKTYKVSFIGQSGFITKLMGKLMLKSVNPDRKKKIKTFEIWKPTSEKIITDILREFEFHQGELKEQIMESATLLQKKTIIASPANKNIVYPLETAFELLITHEKRHYQQAKEVLKK